MCDVLNVRRVEFDLIPRSLCPNPPSSLAFSCDSTEPLHFSRVRSTEEKVRALCVVPAPQTVLYGNRIPNLNVQGSTTAACAHASMSDDRSQRRL
eukprot:1429685-Amphidinium_carterae.1